MISSQYVHENPWWKIRHDAVARPDSKPGECFALDSRGAAQVIALDQRQNVPLVRQFRYTAAMPSWSLLCDGLDQRSTIGGRQAQIARRSGRTRQGLEKSATFCYNHYCFMCRSSSVVEHRHGKAGVSGSNPDFGSSLHPDTHLLK